MTSSGGAFSLTALTDGDLSKAALLPAAPAGEKAWIQLEFAGPQTMRGLTLVVKDEDRGGKFGDPELESSDDGRNFRSVLPVPPDALTIAFSPVTARFFRVSVRTLAPPAGAPQGSQAKPGAPAGIEVAELVLHTVSPVNRFQDKAAFSAATDIYGMATPAVPDGDVVRTSGVVDLTSKMRSDGKLDWTPPAGRWIVLRMGYSLTGARNAPASPEATGLEVDKLNRAHVKAYFDNYLDQYKNATGGLMGKRGLQYVITDSWEAGVANWTDLMMAEFAKRRGYDMRPWLPVLAGRVVESAEKSDRFLWDFRRTLSDLVAENHYDQLTDILHARGMGRYTESHEGGRAFIGDGMEVKRRADIPMSAMWLERPGKASPHYDSDVHESASVAHIYGQNLVAAESLTVYRNGWAYSPETLKSTADRMMTNGLNRFIIHTSVHQPVDDKIPGLGLGPFGQWFTRHETWAEMARPWTTYLARSSYMLQQGRFVADILYYYGEDSNITALFGAKMPDIPAGYSFDFVNADALVNRLAVAEGRITTATGMSYRVLALDPNSRHMSLAVLKKIRDMVEAGAVVVGPKPIDSPSLADDQAEVPLHLRPALGPRRRKGERLRRPDDRPGAGRDRRDTRLRIHQAAAGHEPRVRPPHARRRRSLLGRQRQHARGNPGSQLPRQGQGPRALACRIPALSSPPPTSSPTDGRSCRCASSPTTRCSSSSASRLRRRRAPCPSRSKRSWPRSAVRGISPSSRAAAHRTRSSLPALISWSESSDPGVKYFSGTGTYTKTIQAPADWFKAGARLWLDLGDVKNLAEVTVNGKPLGIVWKTPFRVDATPALEARRQHLGDQGGQPLGQPSDRGQAARRREKIHLHGASSSTAPTLPCFPRASSAPSRS